MLRQFKVFVNIRHLPSEARFAHYAEIKEAISPSLINELLLLNHIHVLTYFYFGPGVYVGPSNCCVTAYVALGQKCLELVACSH